MELPIQLPLSISLTKASSPMVRGEHVIYISGQRHNRNYYVKTYEYSDPRLLPVDLRFNSTQILTILPSYFQNNESNDVQRFIDANPAHH